MIQECKLFYIWDNLELRAYWNFSNLTFDPQMINVMNMEIYCYCINLSMWGA